MDNNFYCFLIEQLSRFNINQYMYLFLDKHQFIKPDIYSTYPELWLDIYQKEQLYYKDPIINYAKTMVKPFTWDTLFLKEQEVFKLSKRYGIESGFTFMVHDSSGHLAVLNLIFDDSFGINNAFYHENKAELQMMLIDFYDLYISQKKSTEYYHNKAYLLLTEKEKEVLKLGCLGLTYKQIAAELNISERTIKFHMGKIVSKLEVKSAKQAFLKCVI